jgi:carbamoyltransferase
MAWHILGIPAFYHDNAASLLRDGEIVAAAQEERFTRKKGDADFPAQSIAHCLEAGGVSPEDGSFTKVSGDPARQPESKLRQQTWIWSPRFKRSPKK